MINIDQVRKQDLRPINARMSKEQISAMEKSVNYFSERIRYQGEMQRKKDLARKSQLIHKFDFWK